MATRPVRQVDPDESPLERLLLRRTWPPRLLQAAIGAWLILSVLLWPHGRLQAMVAITSGALAILLSVGSALVPPLRVLLGLVGLWLFIGTFMQPAAPGTLLNNLLCAAAIIALSFAPPGEMSTFRRFEAKRHRQA